MSTPVELIPEKPLPVAEAVPIPSALVIYDEYTPAAVSNPTTTIQRSQQPQPPREDDREPETGIFRAFLCFYQAFSTNCQLRNTQECLCFRKTWCLECGGAAKSRGVGVLTNLSEEEYLRVACHCCDVALVRPKVLFGVAGHVLCLRQVGSFPPHPDYLDELVCADYCVSCWPECRVAAAPPKCPALDCMELEFGVPARDRIMDRGDGYGPVPIADAEVI